MKLYNTLTKKTETVQPVFNDHITIYSCGPTVYDSAHIGNLSSFIYADLLVHTVDELTGYDTSWTMNFTDVDDKTIKRSKELYPDLEPREALGKLTRQVESEFKNDMTAIGIDNNHIHYIRATDSIDDMQRLIAKLHADGFAYVADDGVYFSIEAYKKSGKTYGQLTTIDSSNTSQSRIANDEYDKDSAHDFALWKKMAPGEPSWEFNLDGKDMAGRPGWHIECSAMSSASLGQPFDVHTGGIDLVFPHHENEIAQSTAGKQESLYAKFFVHNEHLLVDGRKMSKSLNNFYTLKDITVKGFDPLAFRLMILQSHYRSQANFTWELLEAAQNRLQRWRSAMDLHWQDEVFVQELPDLTDLSTRFEDALSNDLNTPVALSIVDEAVDSIEKQKSMQSATVLVARMIEDLLGVNLLESRSDITPDQEELLKTRATARDSKDWQKSDELRDELLKQGIAVRDTDRGQIWNRV